VEQGGNLASGFIRAEGPVWPCRAGQDSGSVDDPSHPLELQTPEIAWALAHPLPRHATTRATRIPVLSAVREDASDSSPK
jgi:hypothetical protein